MRKLYGAIFLTLAAWTGHAQYVPNSGQAFQFASLYNPSFAGIESYGDLKFNYRYQWTGYDDNAPKYFNIAYNVRLRQPIDLTSNALRSGFGNKLEKLNLPKSKRLIHGLGLNFFSEQAGLINRLGGGVTYALHYPLTNKVRLSGGVSAIVENAKVDMNKIYLGDNPDADPFYDRLLQGGANHTNLNVRAGLLLYAPGYYIGVAYFPLSNTSVKSSDLSFQYSYYKGSLQGGLSFPLPNDVALKPSIMALLTTNDKLLVDYNLKLFLQQKLWMGVTYRDIQSGVVSAGLAINERFAAGYSYEFPTGAIRQFSGSSHEIVLSLRVHNFKHEAQQVW
jgi:type IX secretion system PorP/SprF family membrane protein